MFRSYWVLVPNLLLDVSSRGEFIVVLLAMMKIRYSAGTRNLDFNSLS